MSNVCVVGLGKLGAVMAGVFAAAGHQVVGVDNNQFAVDEVNDHVPPVSETGLDELYASLGSNSLWATTNLVDAVLHSDIAFVIVPTPSMDDGAFDNTLVLQVVRDIGNALRQHPKPYEVVVSSTVMPGTCDALGQPMLDRTAGYHVPLFYNPEFIALGSVIHDMRNPDMVLIGAEDPIDTLVDIYRPLNQASRRLAHWAVLNRCEAEIAKISVNAFVTMKISFANQLAAICEQWSGVDAGKITRAVGQDSRIGWKYLQPGGPYGGPCFPRDNRAFQRFAQVTGNTAPLALATDTVNETVLERIHQYVGDSKTTILGLAYKPNTHVVSESLGMRLVGYLDDAIACASVSDAQTYLNDSTAAVIAVNDPAYRDLDYRRQKIVVDVWGVLDGLELSNVQRLGRS